MTYTVGIYTFPDVEALDLAGPYEVFTTASRVWARMQPGTAPFQVLTIAQSLQPVRLRAGLQVLPGHTLASHPALDVLLVPGGVVDAERAKPAVVEWIARQAAGVQVTASVCTGAFLLAQAGVLQQQACTTHWEDVADLRRDFPALDVREGCRWVDAGRVVTSAGISAGIDMSLHLVARLAGVALAQRTARQMDFDWADQA
jgi:transcriptional regulator GlxA family with amidase domain